MNQPVLEGAPEALDAPFRLRRVCSDQFDPEFGHSSAELSGGTTAGELVLKRLRTGRPKDTVLVGIKRLGDTDLQAKVAEQKKIAVRIFRIAEARCFYAAPSVINERKQSEPGSALLKPSVQASIDLKKHADLWLAFPP